MLLRRTVVGINERMLGWTRCARGRRSLALILFTSGGGRILDMDASWLVDARGGEGGRAGREILDVSASLLLAACRTMVGGGRAGRGILDMNASHFFFLPRD